MRVRGGCGAISPAFIFPTTRGHEASFEILARISRGLSGGDILNIALNAIHAGSADADPGKWRIMHEMIEAEIRTVRRAKKEHSGRGKSARRVIGFGGVMGKSLALRDGAL